MPFILLNSKQLSEISTSEILETVTTELNVCTASLLREVSQHSKQPTTAVKFFIFNKLKMNFNANRRSQRGLLQADQSKMCLRDLLIYVIVKLVFVMLELILIREPPAIEIIFCCVGGILAGIAVDWVILMILQNYDIRQSIHFLLQGKKSLALPFYVIEFSAIIYAPLRVTQWSQSCLQFVETEYSMSSVSHH